MKGPSRAEDGWTELWGTSDGWKHSRCKHGGRKASITKCPRRGKEGADLIKRKNADKMEEKLDLA